MKGNQTNQAISASEWIAKLSEPNKVSEFPPLVQRFIFSLRLIAVYRKAGKDPFAELSSRLGSMTVASKALQLIEVIAHAWPEPVQVRRCCCQIASHDEVSIGQALLAVAERDRAVFDLTLSDILPSAARDAVWAPAKELVVAEFA